MPALAPAALAVSVILSALGAVVLCALVVLYGFTPAGEEPPGSAARRLLLTRIGHAVAAVCFAATAILIAIVLAQPPRPMSPAVPVAATDARVPALDTRLQAQEARLAGTEARLNDLEASLRREAARQAAAESARAAAAAEAKRPAPSRPAASEGRTSPNVVRRPEAAPVRVVPVSPPAPRASAPSSPGRAAVPSPGPAADIDSVALDTPAGRAPARGPVTVAARPAPADAPPVSSPPFSLRRKLRDDWETIRRGLEAGERDFWRAVDDTKRSVRRLFD